MNLAAPVETKCSQCRQPLTVKLNLVVRSAPAFNRFLKVPTQIIALREVVRCQCGWAVNAVLAQTDPFQLILAYNQTGPIYVDPALTHDADFVLGDQLIIQTAGGDIVNGDKY